MIIYSLVNDPWQGMTIIVEGVKVNLSLYWVETLGWVADIDDVVMGVAVQVNAPIFKQYGYPGIFFAGLPEIPRDGMTSRVLISVTEAELEGKAGTLAIDPSAGIVIE